MAWPILTARLEQVRPGGRIVSVVPDGCVALEWREDGTASGHYDPETYRFIPIQPRPDADPERIAAAFAQATADRAYAYPLSMLAAGGNAEWSFHVLVRALVSPAPKVFEHADDPYLWSLEDDSWARYPSGTGRVQQAGPRRLWDLVESLFECWCRLGPPARERFGPTVTPTGEHTLWLDRGATRFRPGT